MICKLIILVSEAYQGEERMQKVFFGAPTPAVEIKLATISKDFIADVKGIPKEGIKFSKETNISNVVFKKFPKTNEGETNLEKNGDFYELGQIKTIW